MEPLHSGNAVLAKVVEVNRLPKINNVVAKGKSVFKVLLEGYEIKVPGAVKKQISESIELTIDVMLEEVKP